ncbi:MAG: hypothetical protein JW888_17455 [Pirellulales bacterium]|nr:hypothetical protein [Pirellulales bacterium]
MAEVRGKFINLAGGLMSLYPEYLAVADRSLFLRIGKHWNELEPEGWYDTSLFELLMQAYAKASPTGEKALITLGRKVYPTIKKTVGLPDRLKTPLDFIKYEAEGFLANHRGPGVRPRRFIKVVDREVIVEAPAPGYSEKLYLGVFQGLLEMCGVKTGCVVQTKSREQGDSTAEFRITW